MHFRIEKGGNVKVIDVSGAGKNCQDVIAGIEKALGIIDEKQRESMPSAYQDVDPLRLTNTLKP